MIRIVILLVFLCGFLFFPGETFARNPFQMPVEQEHNDETSFKPGDFLPGWAKELGQKAMANIIRWQALIRQKAGMYARQIRENPWGTAFWSYLGLAFAYGVIHALGPGHGKVFVSTYFLSRKASIKQGILMGGLMSFFHVFSAIVLVFIFYFVLKAGGMGSVDQTGKHLQKISSGLIFLVGLFLAWKSGMAIFQGHDGHSHGSDPEADSKSLISLCLAVGLVPCPGAAIILFFSITLDILMAGMLAMIFLALGLAITTISFALVSLLARNVLARVTIRANIVSPRLYYVPALMGAVFITFLGAVLFFNPVM